MLLKAHSPKCRACKWFRYCCGGCRALGLSTSGDEYHPGNRTAFLYERGRWFDARWHKAHSRFLKQHPLCAFCQAEGKIVLATVVDHIIPHRGDQRLFWDQTNWEALCKECHDKKTGSGL